MKHTETLYAVEINSPAGPKLAIQKGMVPALFLHKRLATDFKQDLRPFVQGGLRVVRVGVTLEWEGK